MKNQDTKDQFGRLGVVLAAAGCAVGLGNIWKFPYELGQNGGAVFLLVYLLCVLFFGIPVVCAEMFVGRHGLKDWKWIRDFGAFSIFCIVSYYLIITGQCLQYMMKSIHPTFDVNSPALWVLLSLLMTTVVLLFGIKSGIERASKVLVPLLPLILVLLIVRGFMLEGSSVGMCYLFHPDWTKLSPQLLLNALGQCFFSLSVGLGAIATYASYMRPTQNIPATAMSIISIDTLISLLAGMAIFPIVFSFGINPGTGPDLVFVTMPIAFSNMAGGPYLQVMFFLLLFIAAITSLISMVEANISYLRFRFKIGRRKAIGTTFSVVLILSLTMVFHSELVDPVDRLVSLFLFPLGGLMYVLYAGWKCNKDEMVSELTMQGTTPIFGKVMFYLLRYVIPVVLIVIFLNGIF